jgi:hypothetical protein
VRVRHGLVQVEHGGAGNSVLLKAAHVVYDAVLCHACDDIDEPAGEHGPRSRTAHDRWRRQARQVIGWNVIPATHKVSDQAGQALTVGIVMPLQIEDWKDGRTIEAETCVDQPVCE